MSQLLLVINRSGSMSGNIMILAGAVAQCFGDDNEGPYNNYGCTEAGKRGSPAGFLARTLQEAVWQLINGNCGT